MESVCETGVWARVAFTFVKNGTVDENEIAWHAWYKDVFAFWFGELGEFVCGNYLFKPGASAWHTHEPFGDRDGEMGSWEEGKRAIFFGTLFKR